MNDLAITETTLRRRLGSNVRSLRTSSLLTLKKAAARAEMHWRHWQKIEAAQANATLFTLARIAEVLNVEPGDLLREPAPGAQVLNVKPGDLLREPAPGEPQPN
jgi:DNA-binding Xre family transcriptional regulator